MQPHKHRVIKEQNRVNTNLKKKKKKTINSESEQMQIIAR